jgi:hypothetical protein
MKALELAISHEGCWRKIPITLTTGVLSVIGMLRQLRIADPLLRGVFLSLLVKERFEGAIALIVWEQHRHNLEGTLLGGYSENDSCRKVMPPNTLDAHVCDARSAPLKKARGQNHLVFIEEQATIKRDSTNP